MKLTLIELIVILAIISIVSIVVLEAVDSRGDEFTTYTDCVKSGRDDCVFEWNDQ